MAKRTRSRENGNSGVDDAAIDTGAKPDNAGDDGNSGIGNFETVTVDPETVIASGSGTGETDAQPRRRGRPPGSGNSSAKRKTLPLNIGGLEKLLVGIHGGLAMLSGRIEWALDTNSKVFDGMTEAEFLAKSIKDVADHYPVNFLDQKTLDWANLTQCLAIIYGGRIFTIRSNPRAKPQRQSTVQETARTHSPAGSVHVTPEPRNNFNGTGDDASTASIAGIGDVTLPDDHPLSPNYKPRMN